MLSIFKYINPHHAPDLIFVHNDTFTTSVILCCTNTFGRLVYVMSVLSNVDFIKLRVDQGSVQVQLYLSISVLKYPFLSACA